MKPSGMPERVMPGMVSYVNEFGFRVTVWLYLSDPAKRGDWLAQVAAGVPGGMASDHIRQEQLCDPFIVRGRQVYYGFSISRNVVPALPVDIMEFRSWQWFLSADFGAGGGATSWLFWAENPVTNDLIIFDEVYVDDESSGKDARTPEHIKPLIWERLRHWTGTPPSQPLDFGRWVKYAVGDPSGLSYMQEYRKQPMAIPVYGGSQQARVQINDVGAGEERLNAYCSASFVCCSTPDNPEGRWFVSRGECPACGRERVGRPRLTILRNGAPNLIKQLPTIRGKVPRSSEAGRDGSLPAPGRVRVEDHSEAAARYGAMSRPVVKSQIMRPVDAPVPREMTTAQQFWERLGNEREHARLASLLENDEDEVASHETRRYRRRDAYGEVVEGPW